MSKVFCFVILLAIPNALQAQCQPDPATKEMKVGDYTIRHKVSGDFISSVDGPGITLKSENMYKSMSILKSMGIWIGGVDDGYNEKMAVALNNGKHDWFPGPLSESGETDEETCNNFNQIWEVTAQDLKNFRCDFADNRVIDNEHPAIYGWPAVGNPHFEEIHGFKLPDDNNGLAPFWDYGDNGVPDGRYNPEKGDFPRGFGQHFNFVRKMQFWIINDNGNIHENFASDPIKMEVQILAFTARLCNPSETRLFYNIKTINRATEPLNNTSIGFLGDIALGCEGNDMLGVIPDRNLAFAHNKPLEESEPCPCNGMNTACEKNVLFGMHLARGPLDENFTELGLNTFVPLVKDMNLDQAYQVPKSQEEVLNVLGGKWTNGSSIYQGGLGLNDSFPETTIAFNNAPDNEEGWSMCQANFPESNKYFLAASGPFRLDPGVKNEMIFGLYFADDIDSEECQSIESLIQMYNETYEEDWGTCPEVPMDLEPLLPCPIYIEPFEVAVYPNPSKGTFIIQSSRGHYFQMTLRNIYGSIIYQEDQIFEQQQFSSELQGTFLLEIKSDTGHRTIQKIQFL